MSAISYFLPAPPDGFSTTLSASIANTALTIPLNSVVGLPTEGVGVFFRKDTTGAVVAGSIEYLHWTGISGNNLTLSDTGDRGLTGSSSAAQAYSTGDTFEVWVSGQYYYKKERDGVMVEHNQDGTHKVSTFLGYSNLQKQSIINGGFTVNQRAYVSNAVLASGAYGHDRWKAGAGGGDYTFTQLAQATQITIKSGKSLIQVVEDKNVVGGSYTLSWEGTAQARFGKDSATPSGAYAVSPITITGQTAGTVMSVEFNEGTLGKVNLNVSAVALPFQPKSYEEELRACLRYYETGQWMVSRNGAAYMGGTVFFSVSKRTNTNLTFTDTVGTANRVSTDAGNGLTISAGGLSTITTEKFEFDAILASSSGNWSKILWNKNDEL